jgi:hypothetical protein
MPGSWPPDSFPGLSPLNHVITSRATRQYNCLAWAAGEATRRWEPDRLGIYYWPPGVPRTITIDSFVRAYETLGFHLCFDGSLEPGLEKLALFTIIRDGTPVPTHAALQLPSGQWTSKLGDCEDISHTTVGVLNGPVYGSVFCYLSRPRVIPQTQNSIE